MTAEGRGRRNSYVKKYDTEVPLDWQERAACLGSAPDFDYDQKPPGKSTAKNPRPRKTPEHIEKAKQVCVFDCGVREACLEFSLRTEIPKARQGIYGGLTPNERDALYDQQMGRTA